jgi:hypothetical protein
MRDFVVKEEACLCIFIKLFAEGLPLLFSNCASLESESLLLNKSVLSNKGCMLQKR